MGWSNKDVRLAWRSFLAFLVSLPSLLDILILFVLVSLSTALSSLCIAFLL